MRYPILALISIGNRRRNLNCWSPLRDFEVKIDRFQIKQNALNLKSTLVKVTTKGRRESKIPKNLTTWFMDDPF